jgi:CrcB protein
MKKIIFIIGIGGFIGSIARYLLTLLIQNKILTAFPLGTLAVNIAGCFLIGIIYGLTEKGGIISPEWRLFLATGICGGFTTFSTFTYESINLIRSSEYLYASFYAGVSVFAGLLATYIGLLLIKLI